MDDHINWRHILIGEAVAGLVCLAIVFALTMLGLFEALAYGNSCTAGQVPIIGRLACMFQRGWEVFPKGVALVVVVAVTLFNFGVFGRWIVRTRRDSSRLYGGVLLSAERREVSGQSSQVLSKNNRRSISDGLIWLIGIPLVTMLPPLLIGLSGLGDWLNGRPVLMGVTMLLSLLPMLSFAYWATHGWGRSVPAEASPISIGHAFRGGQVQEL